MQLCWPRLRRTVLDNFLAAHHDFLTRLLACLFVLPWQRMLGTLGTECNRQTFHRWHGLGRFFHVEWTVCNPVSTVCFLAPWSVWIARSITSRLSYPPTIQLDTRPCTAGVARTEELVPSPRSFLGTDVSVLPGLRMFW